MTGKQGRGGEYRGERKGEERRYESPLGEELEMGASEGRGEKAKDSEGRRRETG